MEISISYKPNFSFSEAKKISCSSDSVDVFRQIWSNDLSYLEEMYIIYLNRANIVLGSSLLSRGGQSGTVVDPKVVFQHALKANAAAFILAHNHPSGNTKPSAEDLKITTRLTELSKLLDMPLLDHLIITADNFYSFADNGQI